MRFLIFKHQRRSGNQARQNPDYLAVSITDFGGEKIASLLDGAL